MWYTLFCFCTLVAAIHTDKIPIKKRICIIGAGPAGLTSAKQFSRHDEFEPIVFEKNSEIGGQWLYSEKSGLDNHGLPVHSGVYKHMRSNFPKEVLAYPDYREFHGENRSFVTHETVFEYLKNYTDHFNIRRLIQFDTLVEEVSFIDNWKIKIKNLNSMVQNEISCEAVMVCTGNVFQPYVPIIPGIDSFPGRILHSHDYREPEEFSNETIALLGASLSGSDLSIEISPFAKKIYLSHRDEKLEGEWPKNVIQVPGIIAANKSQLILSNGDRITVDSLIYCTGYVYDYPFLDSSSGITVEDGRYIHPLYKHFININHPTMAILNVPYPGLPWQFSYVQAHYFLALLRGEINLPNRTKMMEESKLPASTPKKKAHYVAKQGVMDYYEELARAAHAEPLPSFFEKTFWIWYNDSIVNPMHYKEKNLHVYDDGHVELIYHWL